MSRFIGKWQLGLALASGLALAGYANAESGVSYPGDLNISGATLFKNYFKAPAGTNDFIDVDSNGVYGFSYLPPYTQQLAPTAFSTAYWKVSWPRVATQPAQGQAVRDMNS